MDFETLINSPKEDIKEYLEEPKKLKEMGVNLSQLGELIKKAGESITYVEDLEMEKLFNLLKYSIGEEEYSNYDEEAWDNFLVDLIRDTGKAEEYLKNEEMMKARIWAIHFKSNRKNRRIFNPRKIIRARVDG